MDKVSVLEFRRDAEGIIRKVQQGKRLLLTYRGKAVMRLEPLAHPEVAADDPFYRLDQLAVSGTESLSNEEIDQIVYEN
jgi:antitoxin (DNA-binding transcriptional repressor) of toxin-antitoxin stability system